MGDRCFEHRARACRRCGEPTDMAAVTDLIQEAVTGRLHPEFGTEWREPDGIIYKAVQEAAKAERERIAGAIRGHNWRATHPEGEGYQYCRGFWAGIDCAALIAQGEGR